MVEERSSPSAGWHEVYERMGVDEPDDETDEEPARCPDCGLVAGDDHRCPLADDGADPNGTALAPLRESGEGD